MLMLMMKFIMFTQVNNFKKLKKERWEYKVIEGKWAYPRTVVIKFPSYEKTLEWYNSEEYKPVRQIRLDNSVGNMIIIKGA